MLGQTIRKSNHLKTIEADITLLAEQVGKLQSEAAKELVTHDLDALKNQRLATELKENMRAIQTCLAKEQEEAKKKELRQRYACLSEQYQAIVQHQQGQLAERNQQILQQHFHANSLENIGKVVIHKKGYLQNWRTLRERTLLVNIPKRKYKRQRLGKAISIDRVIQQGHVFYTTLEENYINLNNGLVINPVNMSYRAVQDVLSQTENVRDSHGVMIAKRKNDLLHVVY